MTDFNKHFCSRCTNLHTCCKIGNDYYCELCFDYNTSSPEIKEAFRSMCEYYGILQVD